MPLNIVLLEPEIPPNTGNIARTCAATGSRLHLIKPIGFSLEDRYLRRAGLDYWEHLELTVHESWEEFLRWTELHTASARTDEDASAESSSVDAGPMMYFLSRKGLRSYTEVEYPNGTYLVFGRESVGLPESLVEANRDRCIRIPMRPEIRSLNLSNAVAIIVYEALKSRGFPGLTV